MKNNNKIKFIIRRTIAVYTVLAWLLTRGVNTVFIHHLPGRIFMITRVPAALITTVVMLLAITKFIKTRKITKREKARTGESEKSSAENIFKPIKEKGKRKFATGKIKKNKNTAEPETAAVQQRDNDVTVISDTEDNREELTYMDDETDLFMQVDDTDCPDTGKEQETESDDPTCITSDETIIEDETIYTVDAVREKEENIAENTKYCPQCGNQVDINQKFCNKCGTKLSEV